MKTKTIRQVLRKKFDQFTDSIKDVNVRQLVEKNSIITGGCIASMLKGEKVNDYDVYFTNKETVLAVAEYYINEFNKKTDSAHVFKIIEEESGRVKIRVKSDGMAIDENDIEYGNIAAEHEDKDEIHIVPPVNPKLEEEDGGLSPYRPVYISANAITLSDSIQLVIRFYGDAEEIHSNYDFVHCTCWWRSIDSKLELPSEALECLLTNELRYRGSKYPLASIIRTRKFLKRGMTINAGQYLKMAMQVSKLDLTDISVLEDQLIGVDALYFANLIASIPESAQIDGKIDDSYLITLIDRFF